MPMYCLLLFELCIADLVSYEGYTFFPGSHFTINRAALVTYIRVQHVEKRAERQNFYVDLELTPGTLRSYKLAQKIL